MDPAALRLSSDFALVLDEVDGRTLYAKGESTPTPVASITKLMTALVVLELGQPLGEPVRVAEEDVDLLRGSASRLPVGWVLSRGELLHLALMCSDNRAAHALARTSPGGTEAFVATMNRRAAELGLRDTRFADPTGLHAGNVSTARDLAALARAAARHDAIRAFTTSPLHEAVSLESGRRRLFGNSNPLVHEPAWSIDLSKTGYIADSGFCLVMRTVMAGRPMVVVLLRAGAKGARTADARRVRQWLEGPATFARRGQGPLGDPGA